MRKGGWFRVDTDPVRFVYCEGLCWDASVGSSSHFITHAWFVDRTQPDVALDTTPGLGIYNQYWGVPIKWSYVTSAAFRNGGYPDTVLDWAFPIYAGDARGAPP